MVKYSLRFELFVYFDIQQNNLTLKYLKKFEI